MCAFLINLIIEIAVFFIGAGTLSDIIQDDSLKEPKDDSKDGYTCHRLQPLPDINSATSKSQISFLTTSPDLLYNVVREACAQQNIKWPVECQVFLLNSFNIYSCLIVYSASTN